MDLPVRPAHSTTRDLCAAPSGAPSLPVSGSPPTGSPPDVSADHDRCHLGARRVAPRLPQPSFAPGGRLSRAAVPSTMPLPPSRLSPSGVARYLDRQTGVPRLLGIRSQLRICNLLDEGPRAVSALARELSIAVSAVTQIADRLESAAPWLASRGVRSRRPAGSSGGSPPIGASHECATGLEILSPDNQDGTRRMMADLVADTAKEEGAHFAQAAAAHDDQVVAAFFGHAADGLGRMAQQDFLSDPVLG